ncbi:MAG: lytic transglycosylase domain-containing protein [Solirubrobacteraceae bacterium]
MAHVLRPFLLVGVLVLVVGAATVSLVLAAGDAAPTAGATAQPTPLSGVAEATPPLPRPDARLPSTAAGLATALEDTTLRLRNAVDAWTGDRLRQRPPPDIQLLALYHQRLIFRLVGRPQLSSTVVARLGERVRGEVRDTLAARRALQAIPKGKAVRRPRIRTGPPQPPGLLRRHYEQAEKRFGVRWQLLAAVNFVETAFGRLRNASTADARGPMQFIPATWRAYGLGGDIDDPRDAIMGAANYLRASGAPRDERRALFAYNRSTSYVRAVLLHARRIARDPRHFITLYSWQVYIRRDGRTMRITGPGLRSG